MVLLLGVLVGVIALGVLVAGILAILSNSAKRQNRLFLGLTVLLASWMICNFIDSNIVNIFLTPLALKLDLSLALFLGWIFIEFAAAFEAGAVHKMSRMHIPKFTSLILLLVAVIFSVLIFVNTVVRTTGGHVTSSGYTNLFIGYVIVILGYFIYGFSRLLFKRHFAHAADKTGVSFIFSGLVIAAVANLLTNIIFPLIFTNHTIVQELNIIGYVGLGVMIFCIYLSITMQHLFDIKLIVIRSFAYIMSLLSLAVLFIGLALGITELIFKNNLSPTTERLLYAFITVMLAIVFPSLKRSFDVFTDRLFYRDAYDPQVFLDKFNQSLVSNIELDKLLTVCAQVIADNLKAEYCLFGIKETGIKDIRIIGTIKKEFSMQDIALARHLTPHTEKNVVVVDYLPPEASKLKQLLVKNDITALVRLVPEFAVTQSGLEGLGYLMLGRKRSGNVYTSQDVRMLGIIANELVIAIQNALHFEEIQRFNATLQGQVDDQTLKLRRTNKKLQELDETKDDFISMASHQLRTPLTSIKGYLSMVLDGDAGALNDTQTKMLRQAFTSSQRMVFLITDLLNISRLKTGKFLIDAMPVDLSVLAQEEVEQLSETAELKHIELTYKKPVTFPSLMLDETKTRQVIMNFIDNAIYYTPVGGHIRIELLEKPMTVELRVIDDGMGVPRSEQPHLFTKFYRATNARKARPDGTGLGLFMAKKAISAQGGSIIFSSREQHGSTFGLLFSKSTLRVPEHLPEPRMSPVAAIEAKMNKKHG